MSLYAAYGSNMDPAQMKERCPHSPMAGTGWLMGWRLTFGGEDYGPEGALSSVSAAMSLPLGILACLGTAALCGLVNGGMIVALRVHPFIITLGTMAIFRGVAFVITKIFKCRLEVQRNRVMKAG